MLRSLLRRTSGRWRGSTAILSAALLGAGGLVLAESPDAIDRVVLLPAGDRAAVVVELAHDVERTTVVDGPPEMFTVDIGPVRALVTPRILRAAPPLHIVREVKLHSGDTGSTIRVQVSLHEAASGAVRVAGNRVYIDFDRRPPSLPRVTPAVPGSQSVRSGPAPDGAADSASGGSPAAPPARADAAKADGAAARRPPDRAIGTLGADDLTDAALLARAEALARKPDVRGVERLRSAWVDRSSAAATGERYGATLARLDALLDEARRLQLQQDAEKLRETSR